MVFCKKLTMLRKKYLKMTLFIDLFTIFGTLIQKTYFHGKN